jgi:Ras-related protein Rab-11A
MSEEDYDTIFKIVIVGDSGVGKTNLITRYLKNDFKPETKATIGVEFSDKKYIYKNKNIKIQIWDTAGQERYRSLTSMYYKGAKGAIFVYDISSKISFENIDKWLIEMKKTADENIKIILIGNKCDLIDKREVKEDDGKIKAKDLNVPFMETSALNCINVEKAFNFLIEEIANLEINLDEEFDFEDFKDEKNVNNINLNDNEKKIQKNKNCCSKK